MTDLTAVFTQAMRRPSIICDIDGIIADWVSAACEAVNGHFGTSYTPMVWWQWAGPFSDEERAWIAAERHTDPAYWMSLSPNEDMIESLHELAAEHYPLTLSSEAPPEQRGARTAWLEYHNVPYNQLYLVGPGGKASLCATHSEENPAILIDDNPQRWVDCGQMPGISILTPRTSYCPELPSEPNVTLFDSFSEVPGLVAALAPV